MFFNNSIGSFAVGVLEILIVIVICICAGLLIFTKLSSPIIGVCGVVVLIVLIDSIVDEFDEKDEEYRQIARKKYLEKYDLFF